MRKISLVLAGAAGLALIATVVAGPALAEVRFGINFGPPSYYQPNYGYYGYDSYGYNNRSYYTPYYGYYQDHPYGNSNHYRYSQHNDYPGYYGR